MRRSQEQLAFDRIRKARRQTLESPMHVARLRNFLSLSLFASVLTSPSARADIKTGLVAHFPFDEPDGSAVRDASGNNHGAEVSGSLSRTPGKLGGALGFDGSTYIELAASDDFSFVSNYTLAAWIKVADNDGYRGIISKVNDAETKQWFLTQWEFAAANGWEVPSKSGGCSGGVVEAGDWYHVVGVIDADGKSRVYVNGATACIGNPAPIPGTDDTRVNIGRWGGSYAGNGSFYFKGVMDDVRVYNRALSQADVVELFSSEQMPPDATGSGGDSGGPNGNGMGGSETSTSTGTSGAGASGSGGASGAAGGAPPNPTGQAGNAGASVSSGEPSTSEGGGCGCAVPGRRSGVSGGLGLAIIGLLSSVRLRRRPSVKSHGKAQP